MVFDSLRCCWWSVCRCCHYNSLHLHTGYNVVSTQTFGLETSVLFRAVLTRNSAKARCPIHSRGVQITSQCVCSSLLLARLCTGQRALSGYTHNWRCREVAASQGEAQYCFGKQKVVAVRHGDTAPSVLSLPRALSVWSDRVLVVLISDIHRLWVRRLLNRSVLSGRRECKNAGSSRSSPVHCIVCATSAAMQ